MKTISVIIPAYNEENYLPDCLKSILKHKTENVKEVIVVDNASTDKTSEIAKSFPGVTVVHEPKKGLTAARQKGLDTATGKLLAYIDADTRIGEHWFDRINETFEHDDGLVCLSGPYDYFDLPPAKRMCVQAYWNVLAVPAYLLTKYMVIGGNFVARRDALLAVKGFNTEIAFYGEDTDIGRRLHTQGRVLFDRRFFVHTSARRLISEGLLQTGIVYVSNFLSEALLHKPVTKDYTDIR